MSVLKETFIKRHIVERTNKAGGKKKKDQKNRVRERRVAGRIFGMKCS